jgi:hypothetical protein
MHAALARATRMLAIMNLLRSLRALPAVALLFVAGLAVVSCGSSSSSSGPNDGVQSADDAKAAYLGLDASVDKAITLGFAGYNSASSANIAPQTANGDKTGTLTVAGQVDQGASANKGMRLTIAMTTYSDDGKITYDTTAASVPALMMQLKGIPNGTLSGSLNGAFATSGTLKGSVTLSLTFTATLQPVPGDATKVQRAPGSTHITGVATSGSSSFNVDITK